MAQTKPVEITATDTCARCGLRRVTRTLEEAGITIRLCDDCYWGKDADVETARNTVSTR